MTLVWSQIQRLGMRESDEMMHPDELGKLTRDDMVDRRIDRNLSGWGDHVNRMADDIRQHGYSSERHGALRLDHNESYSRVHATPGSAFGNNGVPGQGEFHKAHLVKALQQAGHGPVPVHVQDTRPDPNEPKRYYHGTIGSYGEDDGPDHIEPANVHGQGVTFHSDTSPDHAYATTSEKHAWDYAKKAFDWRGTEGVHVPKVYEVHPTGPVEKDPDWDEKRGESRGNNPTDVRSKHPFEVLREVDPPEDIRDEYHSYHERPEHDEDEDDEHGWY
jgi:hypothetical protein